MRPGNERGVADALSGIANAHAFPFAAMICDTWAVITNQVTVAETDQRCRLTGWQSLQAVIGGQPWYAFKHQ
jgi:hypothetical protein